MSTRKYFYCERWHLQMAEDACMNRYRKGLKKCEGCEKGKALLEAKISELKEEQEAYGLHDTGN